MTLINLTYSLIVAKAEMLKSTSQAKIFNGSISKISMDVDNGNIVSPKKVFSSQWKGIGQGQIV